MTRSNSKQNLIWVMAIVSVLLAPSLTFAGGKGGGGGGKQTGANKPTENATLNYGKVEPSYSMKNKSSPTLYKKTNTGKHINNTSN